MQALLTWNCLVWWIRNAIPMVSTTTHLCNWVSLHLMDYKELEFWFKRGLNMPSNPAWNNLTNFLARAVIIFLKLHHIPTNSFRDSTLYIQNSELGSSKFTTECFNWHKSNTHKWRNEMKFHENGRTFNGTGTYKSISLQKYMIICKTHQRGNCGVWWNPSQLLNLINWETTVHLQISNLK